MSPDSVPPYRERFFTPVAIAVTVGCFLLFAVLGVITAYQMRPWVDEAWYGAPGLTLANHGYFGSPSYDGDLFGLKDIHWYSYWVMPIFPLLQTVWDLIFPQTLHSVRMVSTTAGVIGIAFWTAFFYRLTGSRVAALLFLPLASADYVLTSAAGFGRPDMTAFMFQAAAFGSYMLLRERRFSYSILASQTCVVLSGLTHPNGGMLSFIGVLFLTLFLDRKRIRPVHFVLASVPYLAGALGWGWYILQDPSAFKAQYGFQTVGRFAGFLHPLASIKREIISRYLPQMGLSVNFHPFKAVSFLADFLAIAAVLLNGELRRRRAAQVLLGMVGLYLVFYIFLEGTKEDYYFSYLSTIYIGLLAFYLSWLWENRAGLRFWLALAIVALMSIQAAGPVLKLRQNAWADYRMAVDWIQQHRSSTDVVFGSYELGWFLGFTPQFHDDAELGVVSGITPDFVLIESIYEGRLQELRVISEERYRRLLKRLSEYHEVYNRAGYRVLMRNSHPAPV